MKYDEFIKTVFSDAPAAAPKSKEKAAEDIIAELMPLVEADKKKGG